MQSTRQQTYPTFGTRVADTGPFEAWGQPLPDTLASTGGPANRINPTGFQGQAGAYTDTETGLLCLTHRYYDPGTGRFVTRDPIGYGGGANLYGFTGNNPVNESDPSGLAPDDGGDPMAYLGSIFDNATAADWLRGIKNSIANNFNLQIAGSGITEGAEIGIAYNPFGFGEEVIAGRLMGAGGGFVLRAAGSARAARVLVIANGVARDVRPLQVVRYLKQGEKVEDVVDEAKSLTFQNDVEHAVISYRNGSRALVSGGRDGIAISAEQVAGMRRILGHTHPYSLPGTGRPSADDQAALRVLGQKGSYLLEQGVRSKFYAP